MLEVSGGGLLLQACRKIGDYKGLTIKAPPQSKGEETLDGIARTSRLRTRLVILRGKWWTEDNGPLLGFKEEGKSPVALIPISTSGYDLYDPVLDRQWKVNEAEAHSLLPQAYTFYTPFPERVVSGKDMLKIGLKGCKKDIFFICLMGVLGGVLGLLPPILTGHIFGELIPEAARGKLLQMGIILLSCAAVTILFDITKGISIVRIEGKTDSSLQAAVIDRLISLPVPFFRKYSVGDLTNRSLGINAIRQILSSVTISAILGVIFSVFNLILLFYYSWKLALVALALTSIGLIVLVSGILYQTKRQKEVQEIDGKTSGVLLQFITGIAKIKVSGTENKAFASWAELFRKNKQLSYRINEIGSSLSTFQAFFSVITTLVIFAWVAWSLEGKMPVGEFMAFNSAFGSFQGAFSQMAMAMTHSLVVFPLYQRLKPILQALPESDELKTHPGELSGGIEMSHVSFRYSSDSPLVLKDISLQVRPGEFVAIIGGSGSGKSTLIRLLLGFEKPEAGGIYYDNQDLSTLDIREIRRQIGVVLQTSKVMSGDIFKNIVGASPLTMEDAWAAARMAGLDQDIETMPMKMMTIVSPGGTNLSGGQRQRLLIARALVRKPRIIFFDEATSALDNRTQTIVSQGLESLRVARVVIAHRLSTIINADRIYVLHHGEVIETGRYDELMEQKGYFYELAKRQIV
ncbi:MAG: NHLP bacteriocin export ABC transporter permease/ATPase subunit [Desulfobacca sp.]|nr:NHLP bacteriocin export ABC transporter permease/ATPase subunit [Desulfobacca sp.]